MKIMSLMRANATRQLPIYAKGQVQRFMRSKIMSFSLLTKS